MHVCVSFAFSLSLSLSGERARDLEGGCVVVVSALFAARYERLRDAPHDVCSERVALAVVVWLRCVLEPGELERVGGGESFGGLVLEEFFEKG